MNLDRLAPCPVCGLNNHRTLFNDCDDTPDQTTEAQPDLLSSGELVYQEWPIGSWMIDCGSCGHSRSGESSPYPTLRHVNRDLTAEIERLRAANARASALLRVLWTLNDQTVDPEPGRIESSEGRS